jgi:hypothetical protein
VSDPIRPLLAVDVDGVIALFGFEQLPEGVPTRFEMIGGLMRCISTGTGARLRRLGEDFDLVWATGWEGRANRLAEILEIPEYPYLTFDGAARFGSSDWKLEALSAYAAGRPLAWVDDCFEDRISEWAAAREEPTLLMATESHLGLEDVHVEALAAWAAALAAE